MTLNKFCKKYEKFLHPKMRDQFMLDLRKVEDSIKEQESYNQSMREFVRIANKYAN